MEKYTTRQVIRAVGCKHGWLRDSLRTKANFLSISGTGGGKQNTYSLDEACRVYVAHKLKDLGISRATVKELLTAGQKSEAKVTNGKVSISVDYPAIRKGLLKQFRSI